MTTFGRAKYKRPTGGDTSIHFSQDITFFACVFFITGRKARFEYVHDGVDIPDINQLHSCMWPYTVYKNKQPHALSVLFYCPPVCVAEGCWGSVPGGPWHLRAQTEAPGVFDGPEIRAGGTTFYAAALRSHPRTPRPPCYALLLGDRRQHTHTHTTHTQGPDCVCVCVCVCVFACLCTRRAQARTHKLTHFNLELQTCGRCQKKKEKL